MLIAALWVLEKEYKFGKKHFTYTDPKPDHMSWYEAAAAFTLISGAALQTSVIGGMPYRSLFKAHGAMEWAVRDTMWTRAVRKTGALGGKYNTYTLFNYYPKMGAFAQKGGLRFAVTKVGARVIPYVGWALLAYDLYSVGKWVHGKTKWGNPTPGPTP